MFPHPLHDDLQRQDAPAAGNPTPPRHGQLRFRHTHPHAGQDPWGAGRGALPPAAGPGAPGGAGRRGDAQHLHGGLGDGGWG